MSRYLGPTWKKSRRLEFSTLETGRELARRPFEPGQHGAAGKRRRKSSEYGKQLAEKQKVKVMYGVNERQLRKTFLKALKNKKIVTGFGFLILLESRLDNVCYRLGLSATRRGSRQLVNHGHIEVNKQVVDIPSYQCQPGDVISLKETSRGLIVVKASLEMVKGKCPFVDFDKDKMSGTFIRVPERNELNQDISENLIVEYYNRLL